MYCSIKITMFISIHLEESIKLKKTSLNLKEYPLYILLEKMIKNDIKLLISLSSLTSKFVSHMMWRLHPFHLSRISPRSRTIILLYFLLCLLPWESIWLKLLFIMFAIFIKFWNGLLSFLFCFILESRLRNMETWSLVIK